ncbi:methyltransferase domain-containing protein [Streptomyces sp. SID4928]|uniref:methyltransferase domain-containing protein n=1 Tax=Streptomyces TaxID=1883 RepID=UPI0001C1A656|nr:MULTISPECIES: methyltransferase domain-containing protein [Streptomyces]EGE39543.1 protein-L-isoaspartate(D-aspartate) O-methyltransferase [Streptomyces sp. ACT-1]MYR47637.1 methyltransferase domain-containing protein [Streptomyces sp. SID4928]
MPITADTLRRRSAEEMDAAARGFGDAAWLRDAFLTVPREHFAPAQVWWPSPREDGLHSLIDRDERPKAWLKAVYSTGAPLITQMDDGLIPPARPAKGAFTSSISSSGVIIELLRHLAPEPGERVLELGTGTGYTTALLATRTGPGTVVSIEVDSSIAEHARQNLHEIGLDPLVVTGDGEQGHPAAGPFDRILATASVREIPRAWLEQLRPGGVLLAPLDSPFGCDLLVRLTGTGPGTAHGHFVEKVHFMRFRGQREPRLYADLGWPESVGGDRWQELRVEAGPHGQQILDPTPQRPTARAESPLQQFSDPPV